MYKVPISHECSQQKKYSEVEIDVDGHNDAQALMLRYHHVPAAGDSVKVKQGVDQAHSHSMSFEVVHSPAFLWR